MRRDGSLICPKLWSAHREVLAVMWIPTSFITLNVHLLKKKESNNIWFISAYKSEKFALETLKTRLHNCICFTVSTTILIPFPPIKNSSLSDSVEPSVHRCWSQRISSQTVKEEKCQRLRDILWIEAVKPHYTCLSRLSDKDVWCGPITALQTIKLDQQFYFAWPVIQQVKQNFGCCRSYKSCTSIINSLL